MGFLSKAFGKKQDSACCNVKIEEVKPITEKKDAVPQVSEKCCN
jgi:hypothetical protein